MIDGPDLLVFDDADSLAHAAAERFVEIARDSIDRRGRFAAALSGGSTPKRTYELLADGGAPPYRDRVAWERVFLFSGDERAVPPADPQSNYGMVYLALTSRVPIPAGNFVRFWSEGDPPEAVAAFHQRRMEQFFELAAGERPRFDLVLLGLGPDGHTASLFPGSDALGEADRLAAAPWVESLGARRYTITLPVINHAAEVLFLVAGREKAEVVAKVLGDPGEDPPLPAQLVQPSDGRLTWMVDRAAAAGLARAR